MREIALAIARRVDRKAASVAQFEAALVDCLEMPHTDVSDWLACDAEIVHDSHRALANRLESLGRKATATAAELRVKAKVR